MENWYNELLKSPGFCTRPFFQTYISQSGRANVCCNNTEYNYGDIDETSFNEVMSKDNPRLTDFRRQFIGSNELPDSCRLCKNTVGDKYRRMHVDQTKHLLKNFKSIEELINNEKIYTYDVRFNNLCNLQCLYCAPHSSSRFAARLYNVGKEIQVYQALSETNTAQVLQRFEDSIDDVIEFYFAGGEPLIMKEHYDILDLCIKHDRTDIVLAYSSNLTILETKKYNALDYWSQFSDVKLNASIDAGWEQFEFIRDGAKWDTVVENCRKIKSYPNIVFQLSPVIAFWNIVGFAKAYVYLVGNGLLERVDKFIGNEILGHEYLRPGILPLKFKNRIRKIYDRDYKDYPELHFLLDYLNEDLSHLLPETIKYMHWRLRLKGADFDTLFPELKGLLDRYGL